MKVYSYSEARQKLSGLLNLAMEEEVLIKRRDGSVFSLKAKRQKKSPFDVKGIKAGVTRSEIVNSVRES